MTLRLLEILGFILLALVFLTQIFIPILKKTPILPFFRRKKLISQLEEINDKKEEFEIERTIVRSQAELDEEKRLLEEEKVANATKATKSSSTKKKSN